MCVAVVIAPSLHLAKLLPFVIVVRLLSSYTTLEVLNFLYKVKIYLALN